MSKPIEAGCRAVIVNSIAGNDGIIVTVGEFIGEINGAFGARQWAIDKKLRGVGRVSGEERGYQSHISEHQLRRIDDNEEKLSTWEEVEKVCGFIPAEHAVDSAS